ncbi:flavin reductase family protein [Salipiger marinus]|uniref:NADH-FMN oxidoreductase RutF, flavin reductase (DIM6/NTAB) family n=1 Tax=Salipiger marinus TaxID=555512 RepID=A0A1G8TGM0_9RHOB|nr:flavin reductase family protein [Salipiger marinus]SDJ40055.1 NADH-FMN oxidoreductase RutF, flavin reductase (DIM6/NTAB) family [Salipiger marinus]
MPDPAPSAAPFDRADLRAAFGRFATGVTVVTTCTKAGAPAGFTANSFTSVSLDPPLLLVCIGTTSRNLALFRDGEGFAVNILAADQTDLAGRFASRGDRDRFAEVPWQAGLTGSPLLEGCAAVFDCTRHEVVAAGDHLILVGRITALRRSPRPGLIFADGRYTRPAADPALRAGAILHRAGKVLLLAGRDGGYRLPLSAPQDSTGAAIAALETDLAGAGPARVAWDSPYAIFDSADGLTRNFFFHGELAAGSDLPEGAVMVAPEALPTLAVADPGARAMLRRYAEEIGARRFGLYVDTAGPHGAVLPLTVPRSAPFQPEDIVQ